MGVSACQRVALSASRLDDRYIGYCSFQSAPFHGTSHVSSAFLQLPIIPDKYTSVFSLVSALEVVSVFLPSLYRVRARLFPQFSNIFIACKTGCAQLGRYLVSHMPRYSTNEAKNNEDNEESERSTALVASAASCVTHRHVKRHVSYVTHHASSCHASCVIRVIMSHVVLDSTTAQFVLNQSMHAHDG